MEVFEEALVNNEVLVKVGLVGCVAGRIGGDCLTVGHV
jgi:hypothetical protein